MEESVTVPYGFKQWVFSPPPFPVVVGLVHDEPRDKYGQPKNFNLVWGLGLEDRNWSPQVRNGFQLAYSLLSYYPHGTRIGVEITSDALRRLEERVKNGSTGTEVDLLHLIAIEAIRRQLKVIPLDSPARVQEHEQVAYALMDLKESRKRDSKTREELSELTRMENGISFLRSVAVGRKILAARPRINFIGDSHLEDLRPYIERSCLLLRSKEREEHRGSFDFGPRLQKWFIPRFRKHAQQRLGRFTNLNSRRSKPKFGQFFKPSREKIIHRFRPS